MNFVPSLAFAVLLAVDTTQPTAPAPAAQTPVAAAPESAGPGNLAWASSVEEAQSRAARDGKLVFFEFTKSECGNCKRMDGLLYPAVDFEALLAGMVPVKVDLESPLGKEIAARYEFQEAPSVLVTTPEGRLVFLMEGFFNQAEFFRKVNAALESYRKFARKVDTQEIAKLGAKEAFETGTELYRRSDPQAALPRLRRALTGSALTGAAREDALEVLAAVEFDLGQPTESRKTIERLIATTRDRARRERGELFRAQIPLAENRPAEALALFRKFQKDHPSSPHLPRVKELVERLEARVPRP